MPSKSEIYSYLAIYFVCILGASEAFPLDLIPTKLFGFEQPNAIQHNGEMNGGESNHKQQVQMIPGGSVIGSLDRIDSVPANHQPGNYGQRYNYKSASAFNQQQESSNSNNNNNDDFNVAEPKFESSHEQPYYNTKQANADDVSSAQDGVTSNDETQQQAASSLENQSDNGKSATEESIEKIQSKVEDELKDIKGYKHYKEIASEPREDHHEEEHHEGEHEQQQHHEEPKKPEEHSHQHHQHEESYKHPEPEKKHDHEEHHSNHEEPHEHHEDSHHHHVPEAFEVHHKKGGKSFQYFHQKHR